MRRTNPFEPVENSQNPLNLFRTQSKDGTPKGLTLNLEPSELIEPVEPDSIFPQGNTDSIVV